MESNLIKILNNYSNKVKDAAVPCFLGNAALGFMVAKSKNSDINDIYVPLASGVLYPPLSMVGLGIKDKQSKLKLTQLIDGAAVPAVKYLNTSAIAGYIAGYIGGKLNLI